MTPKTLAQGAEAIITLVAPPAKTKTPRQLISERSESNSGAVVGDAADCEPFIIKDRIPKSYRLKELDTKIRSRRTRSEAKLLEKASKIINSPAPLLQPLIKGSTKIKMPFIDGQRLSEHLDSFPLAKQKQICKQIGESVAKLHNENIIHGDLTTSNMILVKNPAHSRSQINKTNNRESSQLIESPRSTSTKSGAEQSIFLIDFGLGYISAKHEDKAVDLHLLRQALEAKHFEHWEELFKDILETYKKTKDSKIILERLKAVEKRGRYRH